MKKLHVLLILFVFNLIQAQSPILVKDYFPGQEGPIDNSILNFKNDLLFKGVSSDGGDVIYRFTPDNEEITEVLPSNNLQGTVNQIYSNGERLLVTTNDQVSGQVTSLYSATKSDFSDLREVFVSENGQISTFRYLDDGFLVIEEINEPSLASNIIIINGNGDTTVVLNDLPDRALNYSVATSSDYIFIASRSQPINGQYLLVYNIISKKIEPISGVVSGYQDCGSISFVSVFNNNILITYCGNERLFYDLSRSVYYDLGIDFLSLFSESGEELFFFSARTLYRYNKITGAIEVVIENSISTRVSGENLVGLLDNNGTSQLVHFNFKTENLKYYDTDIDPTSSTFRISRIVLANDRIHFNVWDNKINNGVLVSLGDSLIILDSIYVNNNSFGPEECKGDIYYTHNHPEFGRELFKIDYISNNISSLESDSKLIVYPNPATDLIKIDVSKNKNVHTIHAISMTGQLLSLTLNSGYIDVSDLIEGTYILRIQFDDGEKAQTVLQVY